MSRPLVLLYHPRGESRVLPLALLHLGRMLPEFEVRLIDGRIELTPEATLAELADRALCLGVSVFSGPAIGDALRASRAVKRRNPALPVIWGGWHPSLLSDQCLAASAVDACVLGQGEDTFREVALRLAAGEGIDSVCGIISRGTADGAPALRGVREAISFPPVDFDLVDLEPYFKRWGARRLDYFSSQSPVVSLNPGSDSRGGTWSGLPAERVVAEVLSHHRRYRCDELRFVDGDFFADLDRVEAIARGLAAGGGSLQWSAVGHPDQLRRASPDRFRLMRESGCHRITVGGASRPPGKRVGAGEAGVAEVLETAEKLSAAGIRARFLFVAGSPGEEASSLADTYRMVKAVRRINGGFDTPIRFHAPYPGPESSESRSTLGIGLPKTLAEWQVAPLDQSGGPWIPDLVRKFVPRYNFYFHYAFEPSGGGAGKAVARWLARLRVRFDFYRFDFERRLVDLSARLRTGASLRVQPRAEEE